MGHAFFSASASHTWLRHEGDGFAQGCTASLVVAPERRRPDRSSEAAERGTMLHGAAETDLKDGSDRALSSLSREDRLLVQPYVDYLRARAAEPGAHVFYEIEGEFVPDCGGTSDGVVIQGRVLEIVDFKSGIGPVAPRKNSQLIIYALAVHERFGDLFDYDTVRLTIVQPRVYGDDPQSWECPLEDLLGWGAQIREVVDEVKDGGVQFLPTDSNCRWCDVIDCPARQAKAQAVAAGDFASLARPAVPEEHLAAVDQTDVLPLGEKYALVPGLRRWCNEVEAQLKDEVLRGVEHPGWKVVQGRRGNSSWDPEAERQEEAARFLLEYLREKDVRTDPQLRTITHVKNALKEALPPDQLEKVIGVLSKRFIRPGRPGQPTVVEESDSRPAISVGDTARRDFEGAMEDDS